MVAPAKPAAGNLDALKSGVTTAIAVFLAQFIPSLTNWITSLNNALNSDGTIHAPAISTLGHAAASAAVAAGAGLVWALIRLAQVNVSWVPGSPPTFGPPALDVPSVATSTPDEIPQAAPAPPVAPSPASLALEAIQATKQARDTAQAELDAVKAAVNEPGQP